MSQLREGIFNIGGSVWGKRLPETFVALESGLYTVRQGYWKRILKSNLPIPPRQSITVAYHGCSLQQEKLPHFTRGQWPLWLSKSARISFLGCLELFFLLFSFLMEYMSFDFANGQYLGKIFSRITSALHFFFSASVFFWLSSHLVPVLWSILGWFIRGFLTLHTFVLVAYVD